MKKFKSSRILSLIFVLFAYIIATAVGILSSVYIPIENLILNIFVADTIATVVIFIFSMIINNSSMYDAYWSVQPMIILGCLLFKTDLSIPNILIIIAVFIWGIRLTINWVYTFQNLNWQDWRYLMLKEKTGFIYPLISFLGIHYFPTIVVFLLIAPIIHIFTMSGLVINPLTIVGFVVALLATFIEGISDYQMQKYRQNRTTPFIKVGLWKYSRHPNYLGEITFWWGIALMVFSLNMNFLYFVGALVNTLMFLFISIPMADKRQSRKEGYEEYKKSTRMLLPIKR